MFATYVFMIVGTLTDLFAKQAFYNFIISLLDI